MKKILIVSLIALALVGAFFALPDANKDIGSPTTNSSRGITTINSEIDSGAQLFDVRTPEEYKVGYIKGAKLLPLASIEGGSFPESAKEEKIYVYCRSGNRSAQAKSLLEKAGYTNVVDLGGIEDVVALGGKKIIQ